MAVVPYTPRRPADPLEGVSDSFKLMALGDLYQRGMLSSGMFEPPAEPPNKSKVMKDFIEGARKNEERPDNIFRSHERDMVPGEDIVDPERGPQSGRTVKRL